MFEPQALLIRAQCLAALGGEREAAREAFAVAEAIAGAAGALPAETQARNGLALLS